MAKALKYRHELKYYINQHDYIALRCKLKNIMVVDSNTNAEGSYHIRSLYFDDIYNSSLYEKLSGVGNRQKLRMRIYNLSDKVIVLEKKLKNGDMVAKTRNQLSIEECRSILNHDYDGFLYSDKQLLRELYMKHKTAHMKPIVLVDYEREAYVKKEGNVRITFDKNLRTGLHSTELFNKHLPSLSVVDDDLVIMEIKYDEYIPSYIKNVLQLPNRTRQTVSKYVMCRKFTKTNVWEDQ